MSKCVWGQTELPYLGQIVSKDGIKVDPKKVQAVADWPEPINLKLSSSLVSPISFASTFKASLI